MGRVKKMRRVIVRIGCFLLVLPVLLSSSCAVGPQWHEQDSAEYKNPHHPHPKMNDLRKKQGKKAYERMRFAVMGDSKGSKQLPALFKRIEQNQIDFSLTTADLVNTGAGTAAESQYAQLDKDIGWFLKKYPMWPTVGNHELSGGKDGIENFSNFFGLSRDLYRFTYGNAMFIALPWTRFEDESARCKWVEDSLKLAKDDNQFVFVYLHRPFYTVGIKSRSDVIGTGNFLTELFDRYGVVAVLSGHDHTYYRTKRNGVYHIVSAGAGASIYRLNRKADAIEGDVYYGATPKGDTKTQSSYLFHHADGKEEGTGALSFYVLVEIEKGGIEISMIDTTGKVWDKFVAVEKPEKWKISKRWSKAARYVFFEE